MYMNARYYEPAVARFLTPDSYTGNPYNPNTQNVYSYTGGNPVNYVDPTGHSAVLNFYFGVCDSIDNNVFGGLAKRITGKQFEYSEGYAVGKIVGDVACLTAGLYMTIQGIAIALGGAGFTATGGGALVGVPAVAGGLALSGAGGILTGVAYNNLKQDFSLVSGNGGGNGNFKNYSAKEIERKYGLKKGQYHDQIKKDILNDLTKKDSPYRNQMDRMGRNPDIYLGPDGQIQIRSTRYSGRSFITDYNIADFLP